MLLAVDVDYSESQACAGGVLFENWSSTEVSRELRVVVSDVAPYIPGQFYLREMPCILELLKAVPEQLEAIIVDGYVTLGEDNHAGLGMHLWEALGKTVPVIGVAKTEFLGTPREQQVFRCGSTKPLFVTAIGIDQEKARMQVQQMHGKFRFPELLKAVDTLCRSWPSTVSPVF